jgi:hypothetical protein
VSEQGNRREELLARLEQQRDGVDEQIKRLREQHEQAGAGETQISEEHLQLWLQQHEVVTTSLSAATAGLGFLNMLGEIAFRIAEEA